jgi:DNA-directed RNA polymerase subunit RPC12/RpoP
MPSTIAPEFRACYECCDEYPLDHFPLQRKGGTLRGYECRECRRKRMAKVRREQRLGILERFARSAHYQVLDRRLRRLTVGVIRRLGGVEKMVGLWVSALRTAEQERPGCAFVVSSYISIMRMIAFTDARTPDLDDFSDSQIAEELWLKTVQDNPAIVLKAAEALGWKVSPPTDDQQS